MRKIGIGVVVALIVLVGAWFLRPDDAAAPSSAAAPTQTPSTTSTSSTASTPPAPTPTSPSPSAAATTRVPTSPPVTPKPVAAEVDCSRHATAAFSPSRITIPHVTGGARVLALGYDARGVPGVPPLTSEGKTEFAWLPQVHPGASAGNVLLNAHTWPDGTALGNHLLGGLQTGGRIVVRSAGGSLLCYRVTDRVEVVATASVPGYFATDGPPQLAIVVCSGIRRGPGDWTRRTIWYASPLLVTRGTG